MVETCPVSDGDLQSYRSESGDEGYPLVSVIVPVYDEPEGIRNTVESVTETTYEPYEVHVVYTPSTGETAEVLSELSETYDAVEAHTESAFETPGSARNVGIDEASGDVFCFVDANMTVEEDLLWKVAYLFDTGDVDYLGFPVEMVRDEDSPTRVGWYDQQIRFPNETFIRNMEFCPTCSLAVRESVFEAGHRFNPALTSGEDVVFGHEVDWNDFTFGFCPDIEVRHPVRNSLGDIVSKGVKTGWGIRQLYTQYEVRHIFDRSMLLRPSSYTPPTPSELSDVARDWDTLDVGEKALVFSLFYLEELSKLWGYTRATFGDADEDKPDVVREIYESVVEIPEFLR